ncbi:hypothetical protein CO2235_140145 [Cupriavidus oxalaticus]|uniref:Uncharacterized protein n=1 Tax=Cupriavidus oxalaticus TaxID=96344 RepID=A0A375FZ20_9BURK|nr:hypothetical protein CO2235_140145 [Cupriavidus oxalaticus]
MPPFHLPRDVIEAVLISLALTLVAICLFAWYLRRRYGAGRSRGRSHVTRSRKSGRKPGKTRKRPPS